LRDSISNKGINIVSNERPLSKSVYQIPLSSIPLRYFRRQETNVTNLELSQSIPKAYKLADRVIEEFPEFFNQMVDPYAYFFVTDTGEILLMI